MRRMQAYFYCFLIPLCEKSWNWNYDLSAVRIFYWIAWVAIDLSLLRPRTPSLRYRICHAMPRRPSRGAAITILALQYGLPPHLHDPKDRRPVCGTQCVEYPRIQRREFAGLEFPVCCSMRARHRIWRQRFCKLNSLSRLCHRLGSQMCVGVSACRASCTLQREG